MLSQGGAELWGLPSRCLRRAQAYEGAVESSSFQWAAPWLGAAQLPAAPDKLIRACPHAPPFLPHAVVATPPGHPRLLRQLRAG